MAFEYVKQVTKSMLKLKIDEPAHIRIAAKMYQGDEMSNAKPGENGKKMERPTMVDVVDLDSPLPSGLTKTLILNAVVKSSLEQEYKNDGYVGKCFEIVKHEKASGKRYHPFSITEIKVKP